VGVWCGNLTVSGERESGIRNSCQPGFVIRFDEIAVMPKASKGFCRTPVELFFGSVFLIPEPEIAYFMQIGTIEESPAMTISLSNRFPTSNTIQKLINRDRNSHHGRRTSNAHVEALTQTLLIFLDVRWGVYVCL
jgi:hypothetical protein